MISKYNKWIRLLLCVLDAFSRYPWLVPLNDKKGFTITNIFQKLLNEYNHKSNQVRVDKDSEFDKRSMKSWLQDIDIEIT